MEGLFELRRHIDATGHEQMQYRSRLPHIERGPWGDLCLNAGEWSPWQAVPVVREPTHD